MNGIKVGERVTFHPSVGSTGGTEQGEVIRVWSESCVNVRTDSGQEHNGVFVHDGLGLQPGGYYCEREVQLEDTPPELPETFKFGLTQTATVQASGESGVVIGRAEYAHSERAYLLRYAANDGRAVEAWWGESALSFI